MKKLRSDCNMTKMQHQKESCALFRNEGGSMTDQSCAIPTQGESHQSVVPPSSVIHQKLRDTDEQKGSINN
ncbi:hypothetical protein ILYODFUR_004430 [Ilyodon furcidens]|uniref:Uncharacterized protein n=1 Tax=Ilyodon furcidens TaxID=33524 RepID=A0ABV0TG56_9TELE